MSYSTYDYAYMLADKRRVETYCRAIKQHVGPKSIVLDLGSGIGFFALTAAKAGAKKVIAVEPNKAIHSLKETARANDLEIEIYNSKSQSLKLEDLADVVIFDLRGALPFYKNSIATLIDARNRLAKKDAILLPEKEKLFLTLISSEKLFSEKSSPWGKTNNEFDLNSIKANCTQNWYREPLKEEYPILESKTWIEIDYPSVDDTSFSNECEFFADSKYTTHGFFLHADVHFPNSVNYSCATPGEICVSGSAYFPFPKAIALEDKDRVVIALSAQSVAGEYLWSWETKIYRNENIIESFSQNTLHLLGASLKHSEENKNKIATLNTKGEMTKFVLGEMANNKNIDQISNSLFDAFPKELNSTKAALVFVANLATQFSK